MTSHAETPQVLPHNNVHQPSCIHSRNMHMTPIYIIHMSTVTGPKGSGYSIPHPIHNNSTHLTFMSYACIQPLSCWSSNYYAHSIEAVVTQTSRLHTLNCSGSFAG